MAYRDVNTKASGVGKDYENLETILKSVDDHSMANINETAADTYETISPRQPGVEHQSIHK